MTKNWWDDRWRLTRAESWAVALFISFALWAVIVIILYSAGAL